MDELPSKLANKNKGFRPSVSAESLDHYQSEKFVANVIPKSEDTKKHIWGRLIKSFMFESLDDKEMHIVIDAMDVCNFKAGDVVIKQGDKGEVLYVIESGQLKCEWVMKEGEKPTFLKNYVPGEAFGELALLYNAPRAATITALNDATLYSLDWHTFNFIVKGSA